MNSGSQILAALQKIPQKPTIHAIARREFPVSSDTKLITEADSARWPDTLKKLEPTPDVFMSALGTTRAQAGSFAAQRAVDLDLNLALARAAKESGVKTYVLISSGAVSSTSKLPYPKMKGELEDAVKTLKIPHTVIVKPGLLVGTREDLRLAEAVLQNIAKALRMVSQRWLTDWESVRKVSG
ncbi:MAG: hypothetical protein Q9207_002873 [Kuettlingeria erythrocarpa]